MQALMHGLMSGPSSAAREHPPQQRASSYIPPAYPHLERPIPEGSANTPFWMDIPQHSQPPQARTGLSREKGSGLSTLGFFAGIIGFVAAIGIIGVVVWGPEKHSTKSQSHFATDPPPSASLPSLPASVDPPPVAAAAESAAPAPADSSGAGGAKKAKKGTGGGKWQRKHPP